MDRAKKFLTIRSLLAILVGILTIPVLVYSIYDIENHRHSLISAAKDDALRLVRITAADTSRRIGETRDFLSRFAELPGVKGLDPNHCAPQFADFSKLHTNYANLLTKTVDGGIVCSSLPLPNGAKQTNTSISIDELIRTKQFTIGQPNRGIISGRWVVTLEYPLFDKNGTLTGMVGAAIDLARFNPLVGDIAFKTLPERTTAAIIDNNGIVIARSFESEKWVGTNRSAFPVVSKMLELKSGVVAITSAIDNIERYYAITPIDGTAWYATVGIPTGPIHAAIEREFTNSLLTIACGFSVILLFAMWLGRLIVGPLSAVATTADSVAHGNFDRRTPDTARRGVIEVAKVAHQLDAMLDALDVERKNVAEGESRLQIMALYDPLTHLPNRRLLNEHLAQTLIAFRTRNNHGAILVIDLDNFKSINDTRGHSVGDQLIVTTSERLLSCVRPRDWVARLGGDEFVVVLEDLRVCPEWFLLGWRPREASEHQADQGEA